MWDGGRGRGNGTLNIEVRYKTCGVSNWLQGISATREVKVTTLTLDVQANPQATNSKGYGSSDKGATTVWRDFKESTSTEHRQEAKGGTHHPS